MESATALSLSDKVLSRCQLQNVEFALISTPCGVRLKWSYHDEKQKDVKVTSSLITNTKTSGKLYPVQLNDELEIAIFGRKTNVRSEQSSKSCGVAIIIVLDTGVLMAAHTKFHGTLSTLCHPEESTVWCGVIKGNNTRWAIAVVSRGGIIYTGLPRKQTNDAPFNKHVGHRKCSLSWQEEKLNISPLVCEAYDNVILISDGVSLMLSVINFSSEMKVCHKNHKLPYFGVVSFTSVSNDMLNLVTCDGRTYEKTWKSIIELIDKEKTPKPLEPEVTSSVKEVLTGIQRCSKMVRAEGNRICDLDVYMNQLSIAAGLLAEPQSDIFSCSVKIEQQLERKGYYMAHLKLKNDLPRTDFNGKWWLLNVAVPNKDGKEVLCIKLDGQPLSKEFNVSVPLPDLDILQSLTPVKIVCHLLLGHFTTPQPVCQVFACSVTIHIFHFLSPVHELSIKHVRTSSSKFSLAIQNFVVNKNPSESASSKDSIPHQLCHVKLSFIDNDVNRQLFLALLNLNSLTNCTFSKISKSNQVQLWYRDFPVDIHYTQLEKKIVVSVSGPDPSLVLSVKIAIERQIIENGSVPSSITLSADVFEEAQNSCQIFEFVSSKATTKVALNHLHQTVTKTMCSVPL